MIDQQNHEGNCVYAHTADRRGEPGSADDRRLGDRLHQQRASGDALFNIGGTLADIKAALASLVYVPPDDEFETTDDNTVTLRISVQAPQPSPDTTQLDVDIRVEGDNDPPDLTAPGDDPYEVEVNETFSVAEATGTEVFTVTDEDAQQDDNLPPDYLLGVAWVDCGTMTFVSQENNQNLAYEGTVEELFEDVLEVGWDPSLHRRRGWREPHPGHRVETTSSPSPGWRASTSTTTISTTTSTTS